VDRIWYLWQKQNPTARTFDYGGYRYPDYSAATLDDVLTMLGLAPNMTVRAFMDVNASNLCYKY
jgi:tyrosinase